MAREPEEVPFLSNIGLLITYKCQVACPHCVIGAGPSREEEMSYQDATSWIEQAARYRGGHIKVACFTGGEPFFDLGKLKSLLTFAVANGMVPTAVTNAFWATSRSRATEVLKGLGELRIISVSADAYHQSRIPFERVRNAVLAAKELGLVYDVAVCTENQNDAGYREMLRRLHEFIDEDRVNTIITFPGGRSLVSIGNADYQVTAQPPRAACTGAGTPTIFPDGRVYGCIGPVIDLRTAHPLLLGNLQAEGLAEVLDRAETNLILHLLRAWGPGRLLDLLAEKGYGAKLPRSFVKDGTCNLCCALMSDRELCGGMNELARDPELVAKTAYARLYYLGEPAMLERLGLAANAPA